MSSSNTGVAQEATHSHKPTRGNYLALIGIATVILLFLFIFIPGKNSDKKSESRDDNSAQQSEVKTTPAKKGKVYNFSGIEVNAVQTIMLSPGESVTVQTGSYKGGDKWYNYLHHKQGVVDVYNAATGIRTNLKDGIDIGGYTEVEISNIGSTTAVVEYSKNQ